MRRKNVFILIILFLVLALGSLAWYHRLTSDIEFEIPASKIVFANYSISNPYVVFQDIGDLIVYDMRKKSRTLLRSGILGSQISLCPPWIVWTVTKSDQSFLYGYDLRNPGEFLINTSDDNQMVPSVDGNIVVWTQGHDEIVGYDLEKKIKFQIRENPNKEEKVGLSTFPRYWIRCPDIDDNLVVWFRAEEKNEIIEAYDLNSKTQVGIHVKPSEKSSLKISGRYIVWKDRESTPDKKTYISSILVYDRIRGEIITVETAVPGLHDIDISGDIVVWDDSKDIYAFNLKTHRRFPICLEQGAQDHPVIFENMVMWHDPRPQGWLSKFLKQEPSHIRGKIFRRWPGEEKTK